LLGFILIVAMPTAAIAAPSSTADDGVYMVDGPVVNDIVVHAGNTWIGGKFSDVENQSGNSVAGATGLTVFDGAGTLVGSLHAAIPNLGGSKPTVFDLSMGPNGVLYVAGTFNYSYGGKNFKNLIGIDPSTGAVAATYASSALKSVLATSDYVYGGGKKLWRFNLNGGSAGGSWHTMTAYADGSIRGHQMNPAFREIEQISDSTLLVVGQFDWIDGQDGAHEKKVAVKVDATTGQPDLGSGSWTLQCDCVRQESSAFGLALDVADGIAYVAAGGNDWVGAFQVSDGSRIWQTDTNGSAQDVAVYDGSTLVVGGHWTYIEDDGVSDQSGAECPARNASNPDPCWAQARLAMISRVDGMPDKTWTPAPCCLYRGVWATVVAGTTVHIGGEFTRLDAESGPEHYYGRFS
jgi:hypothetical protein